MEQMQAEQKSEGEIGSRRDAATIVQVRAERAERKLRRESDSEAESREGVAWLLPT